MGPGSASATDGIKSVVSQNVYVIKHLFRYMQGAANRANKKGESLMAFLLSICLAVPL